jgi:hypothetical protein
VYTDKDMDYFSHSYITAGVDLIAYLVAANLLRFLKAPKVLMVAFLISTFATIALMLN